MSELDMENYKLFSIVHNKWKLFQSFDKAFKKFKILVSCLNFLNVLTNNWTHANFIFSPKWCI